jgi:hypothetical protein
MKKKSESTDRMLKEKTNQDFNKQPPDPKDPNQVVGKKSVTRKKTGLRKLD